MQIRYLLILLITLLVLKRCDYLSEQNYLTINFVESINAQTLLEHRDINTEPPVEGVVNISDNQNKSKVGNTVNAENKVNSASGFEVVASSTGFKELKEETSEKEDSQQIYVDKLIDPIAASKPEKIDQEDKTKRHGNNMLHTIVFGSAFNNGSNQSSTNDQGLEYLGFTQTINYGDIRLRMTVLNEDDTQNNLDIGSTNEAQKGLKRLSIEQRDFPINSTVLMDNIIGTHRVGEIDSLRSGYSGVVTQRINSTASDIIGISTGIKKDNQSLSFSAGRSGINVGKFYSGFIEQEGNIQYLKYNKLSDRYFITTDLWRTNGVETNANDDLKSGLKSSLDYRINKEVTTNLTLARSEESSAMLVNYLKSGVNAQQEFGLYYFEPEFLWVRSIIGDDSVGALYKYTGRSGLSNVNFSFEYRRDKFDNILSTERSTKYLTSGWSKRLSRKESQSIFYSARQTDKSDITTNDSTLDQNVSWNVTRQHKSDMLSNLRLGYRTRERENNFNSNYRWNFDYNEFSSLAFYFEFERLKEEGLTSSVWGSGASWQSQIAQGHDISTSINYRNQDSEETDTKNNNWGAAFSYNWYVNNELAINFQANYNRLEIRTTGEIDSSDELFTESEIFVEEDAGYNTSATLSINYNFGSLSNKRVIGKTKKDIYGAGRIKGVVFLDENNDGILQIHEKRINGIRLLLNGSHTAVSNSEGEFEYNNISPGDHNIFINESQLPLPFTTGEKQETDVFIELRKTSEVFIPLKILN